MHGQFICGLAVWLHAIEKKSISFLWFCRHMSLSTWRKLLPSTGLLRVCPVCISGLWKCCFTSFLGISQVNQYSAHSAEGIIVGSILLAVLIPENLYHPQDISHTLTCIQ